MSFNYPPIQISAGCGNSKTLAKIASDFNKPNGQHIVDTHSQKEFIMDLGLRKVPGVGRVREGFVKQVLGCRTVGELWAKREFWSTLFKPASLDFFTRLCTLQSTSFASSFGGGSVSTRKSISVERSFPDCSSLNELASKLQELCSKLKRDLKKEDLFGSCLTLKLKDNKFDVVQRSSSFKDVVGAGDDLCKILMPVLLEERRTHKLPLRLLGVRLSDLKAKPREARHFFVDEGSVVCPICALPVKGDINVHVDLW